MWESNGGEINATGNAHGTDAIAGTALQRDLMADK